MVLTIQLFGFELISIIVLTDPGESEDSDLKFGFD